MSIMDGFLQEFEFEAQQTRKALERVPEDKVDWRPHEKSMTLGRLASHIAENPMWATMTLAQDELVIDNYQAPDLRSTAELLEFFDKNVAEAKAAMQGVSDEKLMAIWRMKDGTGNVKLEMPRIAVFRNFVLNHTYHHRGQLTVYLRLLNVPVPSLYGPTADEK